MICSDFGVAVIVVDLIQRVRFRGEFTELGNALSRDDREII